MRACWSEGGYRAFETVESMRPPADNHVKAFVVLIAARFTSRHQGPSRLLLPDAEGLGAIKELKVAGLVDIREGPGQNGFRGGPAELCNRGDSCPDAIEGILFRGETCPP